MEKKIKTEGDRKIIILSGEMTGSDFMVLSKVLERYKDDNCKEIIVDLNKVDYINSNSLGVLIYHQILYEKLGKKLFLSGSHDFISKLFRDCSVDQIFEIVEDY